MKKPIVVFLLLLVANMFSASEYEPNSLVIQRVQIKGNEACTWVQNTGIFNYNSLNGGSGLFWPCGTESYCYATGLSAGCKINGKLAMFCCSYRGELRPGYIANDIFQTNPDFKIYQIKTGDNENNNPDYANWYKMIPYGAPYQDVNNNCKFDAGIDKPGFPGATQTIFVCLTDADSTERNAGEGFGGGIRNPLLKTEIRLTVWTYNDIPFNTSQMFRYQIINKGTNILDSLFFVIFSDPDIYGFPGTVSDVVGCDTIRHLGFAYHYDDTVKTAYGLKILKGPINKNTNDSIFMSSSTWIHKYSYCESEVGAEPTEAYFYMKGFKRGGTPFLDPTHPLGNNAYLKTKYVFSGDPETNEGWTPSKGRINNCYGSDTGSIIPVDLGDRKMLIGLGSENFSMSPGDTQLIIFSQTLASGYNNLNSVTRLKILTDKINYIYQKEIKNYAENFCPQISSSVPIDFSLWQNYPNPFNVVTTIKFSIPSISDIRLEVFDVLGRQVNLLAGGEYNTGFYEISFDAKELPSGIYFYRLVVVNKNANALKIYSNVKKMALIK